MFRYQQKLPVKKRTPTNSGPSWREGQIEGGLSRQSVIMEDQVTACVRKVKESEEQHSPLKNSPHPSASLLDGQGSELVESLHNSEGSGWA